jgi:hypothetical protein
VSPCPQAAAAADDDGDDDAVVPADDPRGYPAFTAPIAAHVAFDKAGPHIRGLHSSTFRLNLDAFCGIGVHVGVV